MLQKPAHELCDVQVHRAPGFAFRLFVAEMDAFVFDLDDAAVGHGHFENVRGQITDAFRARSHGLAIDIKSQSPSLWGQAAEQPVLFDFIAELGAKDLGQRLDRHIKIQSRGMPSAVCFG